MVGKLYPLPFSFLYVHSTSYLYFGVWGLGFGVWRLDGGFGKSLVKHQMVQGALPRYQADGVFSLRQGFFSPFLCLSVSVQSKYVHGVS